jgi:hypothetical protein
MALVYLRTEFSHLPKETGKTQDPDYCDGMMRYMWPDYLHNVSLPTYGYMDIVVIASERHASPCVLGAEL